MEIPLLEDLEVLLARLREQKRQKIASFTDPAEAAASIRQQEEYSAKMQTFYAEVDAIEKIPGPPLTAPCEIAFGEIVEEKMRKQGIIISGS